MSENIDFYVQALNVAIDASLAAIAGYQEDSFTCDVHATCDLDVATAKQLFQFQSDAIDILDASASDIRYRVNYPDPPNPDTEVVLNAEFLSGTTCDGTGTDDHVYTVGTSGAANKVVAADYMRYLAYKLFNTHLGVDLFYNEEEVTANLNHSAKVSLNDKLIALSELTNATTSSSWLDVEDCTSGDFATYHHPAYSILQKIIALAPERIAADMSDNFVAGSQDGSSDPSVYPCFNMLLRAGDNIYFKLTVNCDAEQGTIISPTTTNPSVRTYRIKFHLI